MGSLVAKLNICCWQSNGFGNVIHAEFAAFVLMTVEETCHESVRWLVGMDGGKCSGRENDCVSRGKKRAKA